jgi:macrodomain Ter protein organizer (MatP/YcbG family)
MEKKICSKCKEEKDVCDFYNNKSNLDGKRPECKVCTNKQSTLYNQKNKEKVKSIKQKYVDNNKDKVKKSKKDWFNKNPKYQNEWVINKYNNDPIFRLINIMRARTRLFFNSKNITKKK